ncbi:MAG: bifunctional precorrin-2 dehydrogenase/sirohydrochlorin ferrochelatase [Actinobacteria bacterium]|nr:bifunctional precorrin-2 dehydrogenase/sirohydrochlorin ferrochelatase [Actinomycetota bacterium]
MNTLCPIFIKLKDKNCLVVGGGQVAERKVDFLLKSQANITVISPDLTKKLQLFAQDKKIVYQTKKYEPGDMDDMFLVIAATNDSETNRAIYLLAEKRNMLVNVVDVPELCNFYVPSVYRQGDLKIAISTNGKAPALARYIREGLEKLFPARIARDIEELDRLRRSQKVQLSDDMKRRETLAREQAQNIISSYFEQTN